MTTGDLLGLILSYVYAFSLLLIVEAIRRRRNYSTDFTRKIIHIGAGMWIWAILLLFDHWWLAIIPTGTFIIFNALFLRFHVFSAMDPKEGATPGTAYFAFSCTLLLLIFHLGWEQGFPRGYAYYAMAGIMAMTWGDALASIIGKRFGRHSYSVLGNGGHKRTLEGSLACFVFTFIAVAITLAILSSLSLPLILLAALIAALVGTFLEAVSPSGVDNLTVPIGVSIALFWLGF
jgi:phytol kinase